ncbi:uncharacterized protein N7503_007119 [Penicillium pulvis]|uniref:uncharacterized protein n=1 Tax=Penicillium pulvis TaxID=1562058 RepID=UPI002548BB78|nr:uncharacterized protein N7503_007119 [Penicillium pulvis]KAJ5797823.1 hypothetical protein N7503_007119 [Penicillium pulvis]
MGSSTSYVDLLIIGAGPAGLTAACWAAQYRMSTRIIDQKKGRTETGHADGLQSRSLEILESFGIVDSILKQGIHNVDMSHWSTNNETGKIERRRTYEQSTEQRSRFGQILLNQGAVEQVFLDHLDDKDVQVERHSVAEHLHLSPADVDEGEQFPVVVGVRCAGTYETIHARYLIACDGAHSWVRDQLDIQTDSVSEDSSWGVLDIVPITDFPDIRQSCSIDSQPHGSIMTVPRENRIVRFYIQLEGELREKVIQHPSSSPTAMVEIAESLMKPYRLTYNRVFLTGDAAHTHSPKGGQGMNVSIQDSYNLIWKLGAVIANGADPSILETYDSERRPVAEKLMDLDERLVQAYEKEENDTSSGIYEVREKYAGFMAGVDVTYSHSTLIAKTKKGDDLDVARNIELGMRLPSFLVVQMCDGVPLHLAQKLTSDGWWRILVFPGDLRQPARMKALTDFADYFSEHSHLTHLQRIQSPEWSCPNVELLLIQSCPRGAVNLLDLPELFHPFDDVMGWDYWKTFADDQDQAYNGYGIDKGGSGCLVLCRPDQHVAWIGSMEDTAGLDQYFSRLFPSRERKR